VIGITIFSRISSALIFVVFNELLYYSRDHNYLSRERLKSESDSWLYICNEVQFLINQNILIACFACSWVSERPLYFIDEIEFNV
jgi:hypothetical protein